MPINEDFIIHNKHNKDVQVSVVIPVYNEEESLKPLLSELLHSLTSLQKAYEIIFVDDCSDDQSSMILRQFSEDLPEAVRVVRLNERSGQTKALREGLNVVKGNIIVTLDADLQNDPADIPKMVEKLGHDFDCVCGWRKERKDSPLKAVLSKLGNVLQRLMSGLRIHDVSCTLRVYRKHCLPHIDLRWEGQHRFIPLSLSLKGYKIGEVESHHRARQFGTTKYSHKRIFRVVSDFFRILREKRQA